MLTNVVHLRVLAQKLNLKDVRRQQAFLTIENCYGAEQGLGKGTCYCTREERGQRSWHTGDFLMGGGGA